MAEMLIRCPTIKNLNHFSPLYSFLDRFFGRYEKKPHINILSVCTYTGIMQGSTVIRYSTYALCICFFGT